MHGHEDRRVAHQLAAVQQVAERLVPLLAEVDVVVGRAGGQVALHADVPQRAAGRVVAVADGEGLLQAGQQRAVGDREVGVAHDGVGLDELAVPSGPVTWTPRTRPLVPSARTMRSTSTP